MLYLAVLLALTSALLCAALLPSTGRKAWEGALLGLCFGPVGVLLALLLVVQHSDWGHPKPPTT